MGTFRSAGGTAARRPQRGTRPRLRVPRSPQPRVRRSCSAAGPSDWLRRPPAPAPRPPRLASPPAPDPLPSPPCFPLLPHFEVCTQPPVRNGSPRPAPAPGRNRYSYIRTSVHTYRYNRMGTGTALSGNCAAAKTFLSC